MKKCLFVILLMLNSSLFSLAPKNTTKDKYDLLYTLLAEEYYSSFSIYPFHPDWFEPYLKYCSLKEILGFCEKSRDFRSFATLVIPFMPYEEDVIASRVPVMIKNKISSSPNNEIDLQISLCGLGDSDLFNESEIMWIFEEIADFLKKNPNHNLRKINFNINAYDIQVSLLNIFNKNIPNILSDMAAATKLPFEFSFSINPVFADLLTPLSRNIVTETEQDIYIWRNTHLLDDPAFSLKDMMIFIANMKKSLSTDGFLLVHETDQQGLEIEEVLNAV